MSVAEFYADLMVALRELGIDVTHQRRCRTRSPTRSRSTRIACTRPTTASTPTASGASCCSRPSVRAFPHRLSRQGEPGAFLLGQFRSGGDALFRARRRRGIPAACRTCRTPSRTRPIRTRYRAPASGRAAAGRSTIRPSIPTPIPAPEGFAAATRAAGAALSQQGARRIPAAV